MGGGKTESGIRNRENGVGKTGSGKQGQENGLGYLTLNITTPELSLCHIQPRLAAGLSRCHQKLLQILAAAEGAATAHLQCTQCGHYGRLYATAAADGGEPDCNLAASSDTSVTSAWKNRVCV